MDELPLTFRDAILFTRGLGYRYLWIDSLCIIQNSHEDWVIESSHMQDYYKHAVLTISADLAEGDRAGFLETARPISFSPIKIPFRDRSTRTNGFVYIRDTYSSHIEIFQAPPFIDPLNKRAWTLQESVLSPRLLRFTTEQLEWECQKDKLVESDVNAQVMYQQNDNSSSLYQNMKQFFLSPVAVPDKESILSRWYGIVSEFAQRAITYETDVLPAIGGLAREINCQTGYTYKAGIWLEDMHQGLLWTSFGTGEPTRAFRAPSWSWASLNFRKTADAPPLYARPRTYQRLDSTRHMAQILHCDVSPVNHSIYGQVGGGILTVRGRWISCDAWEGQLNAHINMPPYHKSHAFASRGRAWKLHPGSPDQLICNFDRELSGKSSVLEGVSFLQISRWWEALQFPLGKDTESSGVYYGLMLVAADDVGCRFERVGTVEVPDFDGVAERGWEIRDVVII
jgi:hypothetical protein